MLMQAACKDKLKSVNKITGSAWVVNNSMDGFRDKETVFWI